MKVETELDKNENFGFFLITDPKILEIRLLIASLRDNAKDKTVVFEVGDAVASSDLPTKN